MNNADFWASVRTVIAEGFTPEGLLKLDSYAEQFISGRLVYQRFSPREQHGCAAGGTTNVIASLLAGAEVGTDTDVAQALSEFERERQRTEQREPSSLLEWPSRDGRRQSQQGAKQEAAIERWAKAVGLWTQNVEAQLAQTFGEQIAEGGEAKVYDHGATIVKSIGLDYFIQPIFALDRITLHNTYFPETRLFVIGFGRDGNGEFKIIVEQPFIDGQLVSDEDISAYMRQMGFELKNLRNWTYATPDIYLSDMHDENVILSAAGNIFVVDCDIRINTPELRQGGRRTLTTEVRFL
jgi:hypothetical protein